MKYKHLSEFFDLSDKTTVRCLSKITESEEEKMNANLLSRIVEEFNNIINSKTIKNKITKSKIYKDIKNNSKESYNIMTKCIEKIKKAGQDNSLSKDSKDKIVYWTATVTAALNMVTFTASPMLAAVLLSLISVEITLFIVNYVSFSITSNKLLEYTLTDDLISRNLCKGNLFKSIENLSKIEKSEFKDVNSSINSGKINIVESFNYNNILNEILFLPIKIIHTLINLIINVVRYPVYLFYASRVAIDDYLQIQIGFLENNINNNNLDSKVKKNQQIWLDNFKKLSSVIAVDFKKSTIEADKKAKVEKKKYVDITKDIPSELYSSNDSYDDF